MPYRAPLAAYDHLLTHVTGYARLARTDRYAEAGADTTAAILSETARLCDTVLAPLGRAGDRHPARIVDGVVITSPGFRDGYRAIADAGLIGMLADPHWGGLGLPVTLWALVHEMMAGACMALQLQPLLSQGQIEALERHASPDLQALYLPKLVSGDWTGTMNLTEPQAGSDLGALTTRAVARDDGSFALTGQKIYITWGEHDVADNISHLVLARRDGAPRGSAGISLFLAPKFIPDAAGNPGARNALRALSLEHKLGIHGSPTCVMAYEAATAWLVGAPEGGLAAMFTMMNNARLGVGMQGIGQAEAAFQQALAYAQARKQGRVGGSGMIVEHPDVRGMLAVMKADILAARAIALDCAMAIDLARATGAADWQARAALLTPIAKLFGSETGEAVAHLAIQVHGGMGYVEDTGIAQLARDVRITSIYEGTNGIQALDLVGRKLADGGAAALALIDEVCAAAEAARSTLPALARPLREAAFSLREATEWLVKQGPDTRGAGATAYARAFARVLGGAAHLAAAHSAQGAAQRLAAIYITRLLPQTAAHLSVLRDGGDALLGLETADLAG